MWWEKYSLQSLQWKQILEMEVLVIQEWLCCRLSYVLLFYVAMKQKFGLHQVFKQSFQYPSNKNTFTATYIYNILLFVSLFFSMSADFANISHVSVDLCDIISIILIIASLRVWLEYYCTI